MKDEHKTQGELIDELEALRLKLAQAADHRSDISKVDSEIGMLNEELENRVRQRTAELEAANKELESFAYSVSHDLRAPLRSMDGFSKALLEDYEDKLDEDGKEHLRQIRSSARRMQSLIDGLLELSRITRVKMKPEKVDLTDVANTLADQLKKTRPERHVAFAVEDGLTVDGDPVLLRAVLENLMGNAWKFTENLDSAKIEVGAEEINGARAIFVRDNGVGFDMQYADKLFGAFQRLHPESEFPGTGIGLATVQRIINRHHGQIWAEAEKGKGAVFYFILELQLPGQGK
jgi:light-regulated signal transduction histidine kinase (bacteriophytochrome)